MYYAWSFHVSLLLNMMPRSLNCQTVSISLSCIDSTLSVSFTRLIKTAVRHRARLLLQHQQELIALHSTKTHSAGIKHGRTVGHVLPAWPYSVTSQFSNSSKRKCRNLLAFLAITGLATQTHYFSGMQVITAPLYQLVDWLIDWLIDRLIDRSIDRLIDWLIDWSLSMSLFSTCNLYKDRQKPVTRLQCPTLSTNS